MTAALLAVLSLAQLPALAAESEQTYRTDHFAITYNTRPGHPAAPPLLDRDGDGYADVVQRMARAFEFARSQTVDGLGYEPPPVEGRYRLHVGSVDRRGYNQTLPGDTASRGSFILIPAWLLQRPASTRSMRVFAVHEYFHAIHKGYDAFESYWLAEASATWVQDVVLDEADSNHFLLDDFVPHPGTPLTGTNGRIEYGAFLFLQFLSERYAGPAGPDNDLIKELWEVASPAEGRDLNSVEALESLLQRRGTSLGEAWGEFLVWRWRLSMFEEGKAYKGALETPWPRAGSVVRVDSESCRVEPLSAPYGLPHLTGEYARFIPDGLSSPSATLTVVGSPGTTAWTITRDLGGRATAEPVAIDEDGFGRTVVPFGAGEADDVTVAIGNGNSVGTTPVAYSLIADGESSVIASTPWAPETLTIGEGALMTGFVTCDGRPAVKARVVLTRTDAASGESEVIPLLTNQAGMWETVIDPVRNTDYSIRVQDPLLTETSSLTRRVSVLLDVSLTAAPYRPAVGEAITLEGDVAPDHGVLPILIEYRRPDQAWQRDVELETDSTGGFRTQLRLPRSAIWEIRARLLSTGDDDHEPGASNPVPVDVQD